MQTNNKDSKVSYTNKMETKTNVGKWGWLNHGEYAELYAPNENRTISERIDEDDAILICYAVNSCKEINEDNPLRVAKSLLGIFNALEQLDVAALSNNKGQINSAITQCLFQLQKAKTK